MITTTLDEAVRSAEEQRKAAERRQADAIEAVKAVQARARANGRQHLTEDEESRCLELLQAKRRAGDDIARLNAEIQGLRAVRTEEAIVDQQLRSSQLTGVTGRTAYDRVMRVGQEQRTYRPDQAGGRTGTAFLWDVVRSSTHQDPAATERLARHQHEEEVDRGAQLVRAAGTGAFAGLVVPQYLTELYAPATAALRPFANICNHHDLPADGMTVNISRITTPTAVGLQATENTAVTNQDIDDTLLTENVQTAAGQQTLSRQSVERGTGVEDVTMQDLFKRYATTLDGTLLGQAATGLAAVSTSQTYTNATVDTTAIPAAWKAILQGQNTLESVLLAQAPVSHVIMNNRRWNWLCAAVSASWPVIAGTNVPPTNLGMQLTNEYGPSVRGVMANGLKITVDANVTTAGLGTALTGGTQDHIYVVASDECHLWEDPQAPMLIRAEQAAAASLGVLLVVYGYFAYTFRRYTGGSILINGTGLATPSFA